MQKLINHLFHNPLALQKHFPKPTLRAIRRAIAESETQHRAQICFAVENHLPLLPLLAGRTPRQRAVTAFRRLRLDRVAEKNGLLIYLCLAGRAIEIVAGESLQGKVAASEWERVIRAAAGFFAKGDFLGGALIAIGDCHDILMRHCPGAGPRNEISDKPAVI